MLDAVVSTLQIISLAILGGALVLFVWGRWRHDVVALIALAAGLVTGLVPGSEAFTGFGHPAVITVAAVLVISRAMSNAGAVDVLLRYVTPLAGRPSIHIGGLGGISAVLSGFINNVGTLALMMPVAIKSAASAGRSPGSILMPISFAAILGGLLTLIGTPPNIIVAAYRADALGEPFHMFDFTPVGAPVALAGLFFVAVVGWRLIPKARREHNAPDELFDIKDYLTEARVKEDSKIAGKLLREVEELAAELNATVIGVVRDERRILRPTWRGAIEANDILILEAAPDSIDKVATKLGLSLVDEHKEVGETLRSDEVGLVEAVVTAGSVMEGRTAQSLQLRSGHGVKLLGVSRQGRSTRGRLKNFNFRAGDVLLLQGDSEQMPGTLAELGLLPLAERDLQIGKRRKLLVALGVFGAAIMCAALGLVSAPVALTLAALAMILFNVITPREAYKNIDWSVIVLMGALMPVGAALEASGTTGLIAHAILFVSGNAAPIVALGLVLVVTMTLSDVINNAATAVVMAPISLGVASALGVNPDAFLMAVAIGASCAFLTPIGHQNNALIMGPGGYRFGDYWRMGLPLEVVIVAVSLPMILLVWPL
jgi:di/tricarboxylate transporter